MTEIVSRYEHGLCASVLREVVDIVEVVVVVVLDVPDEGRLRPSPVGGAGELHPLEVALALLPLLLLVVVVVLGVPVVDLVHVFVVHPHVGLVVSVDRELFGRVLKKRRLKNRMLVT